MTRTTSIVAYQQIKQEGLLSEQRQVVYDILFQHGPMTAMELRDRYLDRATMHAWKRLPELRKLGVVAEVGERACEITGRNAMLWDVTDQVPDATAIANLKKPKAAKAMPAPASPDLVARIRELEAALAPFAEQYDPKGAAIAVVAVPKADLAAAYTAMNAPTGTWVAC